MHRNFSLNKTFATASVAVAAIAAVGASGAGIADAASTSAVPAGAVNADAAAARAVPPFSTVSGGRCLVNELSVSIKQGSPGAGQRYATVTLTNTGKAACTVEGYVGLGLTGAGGKALPTDAVRTDTGKVVNLGLEPRQKATEQLQWSVIGGTGRCVNNATHLLVTPPNDYHSFVLPWKMGSVCENGRITELPLRAVAVK